MGGRGRAGGGIGVSGLSATKNGETVNFFFYKMGKETLYANDLTSIPEKTPNGMTMSDFKQRLIANGSTVREISASEIKKMEEKRKADRAETGKFLDKAYLSDKTMVKGSRMERKRLAQHRRKR